MIKKRLSQVLGAIKKGYSVDTFEGGFPLEDVIATFQPSTVSGILNPYTLSGVQTQITVSGLNITELDVPRCIATITNLVSGTIVVEGRDWGGRKITENFIYPNVDSVSGILISKQAFFDVHKITVPAYEIAGQLLMVGIADRFGTKRPMLPIPRQINSGVAFAELYNIETAGITDIHGETIDDGNFFSIYGGAYDPDEFFIDFENNTVGPPTDSVFETIIDSFDEPITQEEPYIVAKLLYHTDIF